MSLSLADRDLTDLSDPIIEKELLLIKKQPSDILHLDLSNNSLKFGEELKPFNNLKTLIIDNNFFYSLEEFPKMTGLETFSANKNQFSNLNIFLEVYIFNLF